MATWFM